MATLKNPGIAKADPYAQANDNFINALFVEQYGRPATKNELGKFRGKSVKDSSNMILGQSKSPFTKTPSKGGGPKEETPETPAPSDIAKYTGNGGKHGELPKRDAGGRYSWIAPDGKEYHQEGYDASSGSWDYLGEHKPWEWEAASTIYKTAPPPPTSVDNMTNADVQQYLNEAHTELSKNFLNSVKQGQSDVAYELGNAVKTFADDLSNNNLGVTNDIRATQEALEAAGLTFQGEGKRALGEGFAGAGVLTPEQKATLNANLQQIMGLPSTAVTTTSTPTSPVMPEPGGINDPINPSTGQAWTEGEKEAAWNEVYESPEWKSYTDAITAASTAPGGGTGTAGAGQYGFTGNLDPYAGTGITSAAGQGSVFRNAYGSGRTQLAESYRNTLNTRARDLGMSAEKLLGTSNLGFTMPSIGGQQVFKAAPNVLGSSQSGYQTGLGSAANEAIGRQYENFSYTFPL